MYELIRIFKLSPLIAFKKVIKKFIMYFVRKKQNRELLSSITYRLATSDMRSFPYCIIPIADSDFLEHYREQLQTSVALICSHQFDLLGSGIKKVHHGLVADGMGGHRYRSNSQIQKSTVLFDIYSNQHNKEHIKEYIDLLSNNYELIDWQIDFKSGFRWSENELSNRIIYGDVKGADIKIPWELGRLQHLVYLPLSATLVLRDNQEKRAEYYLNEFCNQIVDFYISNPPYFGTQWMSTMDVAIRAVNIVITYTLFLQAGFQFDKRFNQLFFNSIADHFDYIKNNLEWSEGMRGNHYFAGIAGLLIIASYLPSKNQTNETILFALKELENEIFHQFHSDGGNFEASLSYHRFSFEMVAYALFHCFAMPKNRLIEISKIDNSSKLSQIRISNNGSISVSKYLTDRLFRMFDFQLHSTSRSQYLPQIGDNDSGYFLRLSPFFIKNVSKRIEDKDYFFHNSNNPWNVLSLFAGFFSEFFNNDVFGRYIEYFSGKTLRAKSDIDFDCSLLENVVIDIKHFLNAKNDNNVVRARKFPKFGLYNIRREKYNFIFRCGGIGQNGKGGHDHNDQLSFELLLDGVPIIVDSGTYCYTPLHNERNRFRSVHSHNTLVFPGVEQNKWHTQKKDDLFWLDGDSTHAVVTKFSDKTLIAQHSAYGDKHIRSIIFYNRDIQFSDKCNRNGHRRVLIHFIPGVDVIVEDEFINCRYKYLKIQIPKDKYDYRIEDCLYSSHYGILQESKRLAICSNDNVINWSLRF